MSNPNVEEAHIAAAVHSLAVDLGGGGGGVNLRWSPKPRPGVWIATVAANKSKSKFYRATGSTPLRALVALEMAVQGAARHRR